MNPTPTIQFIHEPGFAFKFPDGEIVGSPEVHDDIQFYANSLLNIANTEVVWPEELSFLKTVEDRFEFIYLDYGQGREVSIERFPETPMFLKEETRDFLIGTVYNLGPCLDGEFITIFPAPESDPADPTLVLVALVHFEKVPGTKDTLRIFRFKYTDFVDQARKFVKEILGTEHDLIPPGQSYFDLYGKK
jgi:hypothetical protein